MASSPFLIPPRYDRRANRSWTRHVRHRPGDGVTEPLALMNLAALDLDKAREFFALRYFGAL
jgi:hypothetical protein